MLNPGYQDCTLPGSFRSYSLRSFNIYRFRFRETTLTKYILKTINIYGAELISLDRYLNLVFNKFIWRYEYYTYFLRIELNFRHGNH
jgi:hypothetical protein